MLLTELFSDQLIRRAIIDAFGLMPTAPNRQYWLDAGGRVGVADVDGYRSVEVWCALVDTDEENGQLWVVPGSHRWAPDNVRGIHGFPPAWAGLEERIATRHALPVAMNAGAPVIF